MMINGMTVEEYNDKERRRSSIVARLHGYTPMEDGDTEEALKAEYLEIMHQPYMTQAEERAESVKKAEEARAQRIAAGAQSDASDHRRCEGERIHAM